MPLATRPGVVVAQNIELLLDLSSTLLVPLPSHFLAYILGIAYCLADLPNSYLKRKFSCREKFFKIARVCDGTSIIPASP